MATNSRAKGARGERELANEVLKPLGFTARRGQQRSGLDEKDVIAPELQGYHVECKYRAKLNTYAAYRQADRDAREGEVPVVAYRLTGRTKPGEPRLPWLALLRAKDFFALVMERYRSLTRPECEQCRLEREALAQVDRDDPMQVTEAFRTIARDWACPFCGGALAKPGAECMSCSESERNPDPRGLS